MSIQSDQLKERAMAFADSSLRLVDRLPQTPGARVMAHQLAKAATAVAANYRATCLSRSRTEFIAKLAVVVEEADESACWLELIRRQGLIPSDVLAPVLNESLELRAIFGKSLGTARANARSKHPIPNPPIVKTITR